jgi:hypothetical protein
MTITALGYLHYSRTGWRGGEGRQFIEVLARADLLCSSLRGCPGLPAFIRNAIRNAIRNVNRNVIVGEWSIDFTLIVARSNWRPIIIEFLSKLGSSTKIVLTRRLINMLAKI